MEASDIAADGQPLEPGASWFLDDGRLESALAAAVESGLGSSSQESLMGRIREVGRHSDAAEDEITLTVELHMLVGDSKGDELRPETRVFRIKDPLGLARRFPEIRELGGLASLYQLARESRTQ